MKTLLLATILSLTLSCKKEEKPTPQTVESEKISALRDKIKELEERIEQYRDATTGWVNTDCDGMLWEGKLNAGYPTSDILATQFDDSAGLFGRTPNRRCYDAGKNNGADSTWSRDMAVGLLYWGFRTKAVDILQSHANYGVENQWRMGEPISDGRVLYTPNMIGLLYQTIFALGGKDNHNRLWPPVYPAGLTDYEAHLQVMSIALRGEIQTEIKNPVQIDLSLSGIRSDLVTRLKEHAQREPENLFFKAVYSSYTGDFAEALEMCLAEKTKASYLRCDTIEKCTLSELIFSCDYILRELTR